MLFDFDKSTIKTEYTEDLDRGAEVLLNEEPNLRIEIQGWTEEINLSFPNSTRLSAN